MKIGTLFNVVDNSGAKKFLCIGKLLKNSNKICLGDIILGVIKKIKVNSAVKKSSILKGIIVRSKVTYCLNDGSIIKFKDNAVVLLDKNNIPLGTRVFGIVSKKILLHKFSKLQNIINTLI